MQEIKPINIMNKFSLFNELWTPKIIGELNNQYVKICKLKDDFVWHSHKNEDELFLVFKGTLVIDFRNQKTMTELENIFISVGFKIISKRNITKQVLEALDMINESKKEKINQLVPKSIRRSFETFAGVQGTPVYQAFVEERLQYYCYQLKKIS